MSARDAILGRVRRSLGVSGEEPARNATVDDRMRRAPAGIIPARAQLPEAERLALFIDRMEFNAATVARIDTVAELAGAVADYLRAQNLPATVRFGNDALIAGVDWGATAIEVKRGKAEGSDAVGLSHAMAGVAETGTLVLTSGPDNPTTINFLPDNHIVVLAAGDVVGDYETAWATIRVRFGKGAMPRTVNWISGPSRSSDIQQTTFLGAHGPRRLHVIIIG